MLGFVNKKCWSFNKESKFLLKKANFSGHFSKYSKFFKLRDQNFSILVERSQKFFGAKRAENVVFLQHIDSSPLLGLLVIGLPRLGAFPPVGQILAPPCLFYLFLGGSEFYTLFIAHKEVKNKNLVQITRVMKVLFLCFILFYFFVCLFVCFLGQNVVSFLKHRHNKI